MKLHLTYISLFIALFGFSANAQIKVSEITCNSTQDGEVSLQGYKIKAKLPTPPRAKLMKPKCERVTWNQQVFIGVQYETHEIISYESTLKDVTSYAVFKISPTQATHMLSASVSGYSTAWMLENKLLVLRVLKTKSKAPPALLEGYVYDPKANEFTDLEAYAYMHNWSKK
jgi:hypothetical protein